MVETKLTPHSLMKRLKEWFVTSPVSKIIVGGLLSMSFGMVAHAANLGSLPSSNVNSASDVAQIMCSFLAYFFWFIMVISVIMVLVAAFQYVTAGDDTEKTSKARRTITYAAVGIAVALVSTALPDIVGSIFPSNPGASLNDVCTGIGL